MKLFRFPVLPFVCAASIACTTLAQGDEIITVDLLLSKIPSYASEHGISADQTTVINEEKLPILEHQNAKTAHQVIFDITPLSHYPLEEGKSGLEAIEKEALTVYPALVNQLRGSSQYALSQYTHSPIEREITATNTTPQSINIATGILPQNSRDVHLDQIPYKSSSASFAEIEAKDQADIDYIPTSLNCDVIAVGNAPSSLHEIDQNLPAIDVPFIDTRKPLTAITKLSREEQVIEIQPKNRQIILGKDDDPLEVPSFIAPNPTDVAQLYPVSKPQQKLILNKNGALLPYSPIVGKYSYQSYHKRYQLADLTSPRHELTQTDCIPTKRTIKLSPVKRPQAESALAITKSTHSVEGSATITHTKNEVEGQLSAIEIATPALLISHIPTNYYNIHSLIAGLAPSDESREPIHVRLHYQMALAQMERPTFQDNFQSLNCHFRHSPPPPLNSRTSHIKAHIPDQDLIDIELTPSSFELIDNLPRSIFASIDGPQIESQLPVNFIESRPMMIRALKYLTPHIVPSKLFSFETLKTNRPLLVTRAPISQKIEVSAIPSTELEAYGDIENQVDYDIKPLPCNLYHATREVSDRGITCGILMKEFAVKPAQFDQLYVQQTTINDQISIIGFDQTLYSYQVPENPPRLKKQAPSLDELAHLSSPFTIEDKSPLDLPSYRSEVVTASSEILGGPSNALNELNSTKQMLSIQLAHSDQLNITDETSFTFNKTGLETPNFVRSYWDQPLEREALEVRNNPIHTLSFIHKVKPLRYKQRYITKATPTFKRSYRLTPESHSHDLLHSVQKIVAAVPGHRNRFTDYIDLLNDHERHFIPSVGHLFVKNGIDLPDMLEYGKAINDDQRHLLDYISSVPSLYQLNTQVLSSEFKANVEVISKPKQKGYFFAIKLTPFFPEELRRVRQNIYFVMDQCRTINKERFNAFKKSILRALPYMHPDDTFNVIAFDSKFEKLSSVNQFYTKETLEQTRRFLSNVSYGSLSSPQDYSRVLKYISDTFNPDPQELNTVILLTDGAAYKSHHLQREKVEQFTAINDKRFAVHTVSAAQHNYLSALDLISFLNHGSMLHSRSHAALPRQLALLVKKMRYPIATDVHLTLLNSTSNEVKFFPGSGHFQHFYGHKPLTIYGEADELCEFDIMLQGKSEDEWMNITYSVNLQQATSGDRELLRDSTLMENKTRYYLNGTK